MIAQFKTSPGDLWRWIWPSHGDDRNPRQSGAQAPAEMHREFQFGQSGVSYDNLFGPYLVGACRITIRDPFIQEYYQARNMMELLETIVRGRTTTGEIAVHLVTRESPPEFVGKQAHYLGRVEKAAQSQDIRFTWEFDPLFHDRSIETDHGWMIILGRGLDIFQKYELNDGFDFQNRLQICRAVKEFSITVICSTRRTTRDEREA
ncbi:MAG: hypothetical protein DCC51_03865 [Anaerolineae bacterium]|nr:MAG: hypothetical protein DCC51_03865 [Anaerolineae bacterium]